VQAASPSFSPADSGLLQFGKTLYVDDKGVSTDEWATEIDGWRQELGLNYFDDHTLIIVDNHNQITNAMTASRFETYGGDNAIIEAYSILFEESKVFLHRLPSLIKPS
jgi:hypothetical protein